ncbi:MAG: hypothetical protein LCH81_18760 [Bacteroidetes bacterium]|nr:hypothetical protein [Bacteroidota bacterium]
MNTGIRLLANLFLLSFVLTACHTAQKFAESGDYDSAIDFCVRKLQGKSKKKTEYVQGLEVAFQKAQARDLDAIDHLVAENRPENWERVNAIHRNIRDRQNKVTPLMPLQSKDGYAARFELVDIARLESESRQKAADHLYNQAKELIAKGERGDKLAARDAYYALCDLESHYYRDYKDKNELMATARNLGTSYILFEMKNQSNTVLPRQFAERLMNIGKQDLDSDWKEYFFEEKSGVQYDYKATFKVRNIDISPERVNERNYIDEKEIEDGFEYVLDAKGNVLKDSLGNDVKRPRYVRIRANVVEVYQTKAARLTGYVEIYDLSRKVLMDTRDMGTEVLFENYASTFSGDERALSRDSRLRIGNRPLPFPADEDMLVQAAERIKPNLRDELRRNRAIL